MSLFLATRRVLLAHTTGSNLMRKSAYLLATAEPAASVGRPAASATYWTKPPVPNASFWEANEEEVSKIYGKHFTISQRCWDCVHRKNAAENIPNSKRFLRLAVESGGCHGYMYKFQFDADLDEEMDVVFSEGTCNPDGFAARQQQQNNNEASASSAAPVEPALVVVDKSTADCMVGAVLDFHTELKGSAFVVVGNEKVDHLCACAMSFSVKK